jgi:GT2 family glycosyltransferase
MESPEPASEVTVVIPVHDRLELLGRALASVAGQSGVGQVVVVDDASAEPPEIVQERLPKHVTYVRLPENVGPGGARNNGVHHANKDLIAFLDADDEWHPGKLEAQLAALRPNSFVTSDFVRRDDVRERERPVRVRRRAAESILYETRYNPSGLLLRRSDFERVGGFPSRVDCAEDWVLAARLIAAGLEALNVPKTLFTVHSDGTSRSETHRARIDHMQGALRCFVEDGLAPDGELERVSAVIHGRSAAVAANAGYWGETGRHARAALRRPLSLRVVRELANVPFYAARGALRRARSGAR